MNSIVFYLNGSRREIQNPDPEVSLLEYVRVQERLTGSKLGCGEGGCGACTVMVWFSSVLGWFCGASGRFGWVSPLLHFWACFSEDSLVVFCFVLFPHRSPAITRVEI